MPGTTITLGGLWAQDFVFEKWGKCENRRRGGEHSSLQEKSSGKGGVIVWP